MAIAQEFTKYKTADHSGYSFDILRQGGYGQDTYIAVSDALSIKTEAYATVKEAEKAIIDLIDRTYAETFKGATPAKAATPIKKAG